MKTSYTLARYFDVADLQIVKAHFMKNEDSKLQKRPRLSKVHIQTQWTRINIQPFTNTYYLITRGAFLPLPAIFSHILNMFSHF